VTYRDGAGNRLVISQGFPAMINARFALPGSEKRVLEVNGRQALWSDRAIIAFPNFKWIRISMACGQPCRQVPVRLGRRGFVVLR